MHRLLGAILLNPALCMTVDPCFRRTYRPVNINDLFWENLFGETFLKSVDAINCIEIFEDSHQFKSLAVVCGFNPR